MAVVSRIASFHLVRDASALRTMRRLGTDHRLLSRVDGLRFWRLLGTGRGDGTGPGADLRRSALFAVWDGDEALDAFTASMRERWEAADESWHVRLRGGAGHGRWRGVDVLDDLQPAHRTGGPIAIVTRADVRVRSWRAFRAAGTVVDRELHASPGLLAVVGIGEAPVGRLGTFSLWRDLDAARAFARRGPDHVEVVRRTRQERWYAEELFARFEPYASTGTWDGTDPLTDPDARPDT
jgi:hypothetical protein